ncbi:MAG TPA: type VI secretion system tip protein VgrG [Chryseolinea sp.]|nr:type VI secretion system tip protein VgrG [Chryseolinea sp.]
MKNVVSYILRSEGKELSDAAKVKSIVIVNETNRIPRANILLLDGDVSKQNFPMSNQDLFKPGKLLEIDIGYESKCKTVFKGIIVKMSIKIRESNASYLEIICKHSAAKLTTRKRNHMFFDVNDKDAISQILDNSKIKHDIKDLTDTTHPQLVQYECSDWDFILSRIESNGSLAMFDNETLRVSKPSMTGSDPVKYEYGANVISFDAQLDSESQFGKVESRSWSSADQDITVEEATSEFRNEIGNISSQELAGVLNSEPYVLQHTGNLSLDELGQWAKAKAVRHELSKIIGYVGVRGNADVYPGKLIELSGFGDRFSGKAFVTGVRHEVTQGNWTSHIQFGLSPVWLSQQPHFNALPAAGMLPAVNGLLVGVVTQLEQDPENEFRIKVRIPIVNNEEEGIWARQAKLYAGDDYGICFAPEIGDEVVVGFLNEDPRKPIILGVLHSSAKASPLSLSDDNFEKGIISKNGLKILWDDKKKLLSLSTPGGHKIQLDDEGKTIAIQDSNNNKFEMNDQGISLKSAKGLKLSAQENIEFEGINIQSKASGKFSAEGNAGAEVKTSSIAVLKGALVQIN